MTDSPIPPSDPGGQTVRAGDSTSVLPIDVREAASDVSKHFGPRGPNGRPKYYKIRQIGQGGMGAVFLGWDTHLGRYVAIKFLLGSADEESVKRFRREAQACAQIRHPHIVPIHEADVWQGTPYIAMDYIEGSTLAAVFARKGCTREQVLRWMSQISRALATAHDRHIVHRDIKPQNIFIDSNGFPYLGDFGLAKSLDSGEMLTAAGAVVGTPSYMAPEQASDDDSRIGPRTDVYALGAVLYEGVTGRRPFTGRDALSVMHKVLHETPQRPREIDATVSPDLEALILGAMARDPGQRFASVRELADAIDRVTAGQAPSLPAPPKKKSPVGFIVAVVALVGFVGLIATAAVVFIFFHRGKPTPESKSPAAKVATHQEPDPEPEPPTPPTPEPPPDDMTPEPPEPTPKPGTGIFGHPSGQDTWDVEIPGIDLKSVKMRQHWNAIWKIAREWRKDAVLVRIWGTYVKSDGTVDVSDPNDYDTSWAYAFYSADSPAKRFDNDSDKRMVLYIRNGKTFINTPAGNCSDLRALPPEFLDSDAIWKLLASTGARDSANIALSINTEWEDKPLHRGDFTGASPSGEISVIFDFVTGKISE